MNKAAQALGRMAKGHPKQFTASEIEKRTQRLAEARKVKQHKRSKK